MPCARTKHPPSKVDTEKGPIHPIRFRITSIPSYIAAAWRRSVEPVLVLAITTRPLIVPQVVRITCLRGRLGLDRRRVRLDSRRPLLATDDFLRFLRGFEGLFGRAGLGARLGALGAGRHFGLVDLRIGHGGEGMWWAA